MRKLWRNAALLVVGIAVGVGIGFAVKSLRTSESDRVEETATAYLQAFANNDPAALCANISPLGRAQVQYGVNTCEQGAGTMIKRVPQAERNALRSAEVTVVSVGDRTAVVRFSPKLAGRGDMQLIKLADQWLVNS